MTQTTPKPDRALILQDGAGAPVLCPYECPAPGPGEVALRIHAAALNFADLLMIKGEYQATPPRPFVMGMELAGKVTAVGPGVDGLSPGDRVAAFAGQGALADTGVFAATACRKIPEAMPYADAAAFSVAYGTSHLALAHRALLQKGETLAVIGAAGGVGLTAVEIGARMGARVIACARGAGKLEIARKAGAHELLDSTDPDLKSRLRDLGGVDVVYDAVGADPGTQAFGALKPGGRFIVIGFAGGGLPKLKPNHMLVKNITVHGLYWGGYARLDPATMAASLDTLFGWYAKGGLRPHISHRFPLAQATDALAMLGSGKATGKVVVTMNAED